MLVWTDRICGPVRFAMTNDDDWRLMGQEKYLKGVTLSFQTYRCLRPDWDHDHCAFCSAKFMEADLPDILREGYTAENQYHWVCPTCFDDFKDRFEWVLVKAT